MPQKSRQKCFCHLVAFPFLFEMPQNRTYSFSVLFRLKLITYFLSEMRHFKCPKFLCSKYLKVPFFLFDSENFEHKNIGHFEFMLKQKRNRKWNWNEKWTMSHLKMAASNQNIPDWGVFYWGCRFPVNETVRRQFFQFE